MNLLSKVTTVAKSQPARVVLHAGEKFGKTSFAAYSPNPIFLMTAGETGLLPLIETGKVPAVPHFPNDFQTWGDLWQACEAIRDEEHSYRTFVLDTGNGAENLCAAYVCDQSFGNNWAEYNSYGRGNELAKVVWTDFLKLIDSIRTKRTMSVMILHHSKVKTFNNPNGKDWDQWRPEAIDKLWALTHKWADVILFGGWNVAVSKDEKATGEKRYLRAGATASVVAGNRYGLPDVIDSAPGADKLWQAFADAMKKAKSKPNPTGESQ